MAIPFGMTIFQYMRKMGLEPTRDCSHKILSLARLPIPTLPHPPAFTPATDIISENPLIVKRFFAYIKENC